MDDAGPSERPYRLTVELEHDPRTGAWCYWSEVETPAGGRADLTSRTWHRWKDRWRLVHQLVRADVALIETWADGALEAMPRG